LEVDYSESVACDRLSGPSAPALERCQYCSREDKREDAERRDERSAPRTDPVGEIALSGRRWPGRRERQCWILSKDLALELPEGGAGIEPELVRKRLTAFLVDMECLGLPSGAIQGEHELGAEPLTQRVRYDHALELGYQLRVRAEVELGVESVLEGGEAQPLDARGLLRAKRS
jgi:hypothetical protein